MALNISLLVGHKRLYFQISITLSLPFLTSLTCLAKFVFVHFQLMTSFVTFQNLRWRVENQSTPQMIVREISSSSSQLWFWTFYLNGNKCFKLKQKLWTKQLIVSRNLLLETENSSCSFISSFLAGLAAFIEDKYNEDDKMIVGKLVPTVGG